MVNNFIYEVDNKSYQVIITHKRIRNIHYRFDGEKFLVSAPRLVSLKQIKSGLEKFAQKLIKRSVQAQAETDEFIYLLGEKKELVYPGSIEMNDGAIISYKDEKQMHTKLRKWFLLYLEKRVRIYEEKMGAPHYEVKVRMMKSRYGSNNRSSESLTFSMVLVHYSEEIIDSVIVHELAHCFVYDHSAKFYKVVYKYCPNYDMLRKKLIKAEFN